MQFLKNLWFVHASRHEIEDVYDANTHTADAGLPSAFAGFHRNAINQIFHMFIVC